mmetsp:Transcript_12364/g.26712  ORF Transcript_12364/g.26712 Transcript_12364/m.26712 type:complete len:579 (-) Transcript_12364:1179-2915(-)|eukprot:CAMPEP_0202902084 /NCGR_PEP_ID=MMETSP1392-20130828/16227_1 /ASSEMBLY_ACC=CAM_ASM_000868 /TAXON_ID=225041 /ORGANISM="Chlamydomonas chlamydogama, Strain SAG 11-48b" /LENGTH=578 /DNA_ID=CAMNT_0049588783 /DNA_START=157 /DNA_END=1893 /DNA_ORIENTATION=+
MEDTHKGTLSVQMGSQQRKRGLLGHCKALLDWYLLWALPGLGMFSEAYIIFSAGQIGPFQKAMWPSCYADPITDCKEEMIKHVASYIQICGIMAGMLLWGWLGDITGRKWGSRCVAFIMLSGCILLTFTPWATTAYGYFAYFMTAQTWYGFGVGGEYPMAASSAAELSAVAPELQGLRGRQVILVFSNQGMGNFVNGIVILLSMIFFGQTGATLDADGSKNVLALTYGFGAVACLVMVVYRAIYLDESKLFEEEKAIEEHIIQKQNKDATYAIWHRHKMSAYYYWPRQMVASAAWIANDFAFYGNKLQQGLFINLLYPGSTPYKIQQWTVLNSFVALTGYYMAAWLVDKHWYGRRLMQNVGFIAMFIFYIIIYAQWEVMGDKDGHTKAGTQWFQFLYYMSSFFNQFGPNATTWLVAGEIFPTDIRSTYHGFAACMGKLGAIIASLWISYIADKRKVFLISAIWGIGGFVVTWIWLPDTTGMQLEEYDRLQRYILEGRFKEYHGEAVNPRHLSPWEKWVYGWHKKYDPSLDALQFQAEMKAVQADQDKEAERQFKRMSEVGHAHDAEHTVNPVAAVPPA